MQKEPLFAFTGIFTLKSKVTKELLCPLLNDVRVLFREHILSEQYGTGLNFINIKYLTAEKKSDTETEFEKGIFYPKKESYVGFVIFGQGFASLSEREMKKTIQNLLFQVIEDVAKKLKKHSINFDSQALRNDMEKVWFI